MRAVVVTGVRQLELRDVAPPEIGPGDVLIRVRTTGLCGSDVHAYLGTHPFRKPPMILGHELSGQVEAVGKNVTQFRPGDRVTVEPQLNCGACGPCRAGAPNLCRRKVVLGTTPWPGSFGELIAVPERVVYKLPDALDFELGALVEPLAVGVHAARVSGLGLGGSAAVFGSGPIGLACLAAARQAGATRLAAVDLQDHNLELARGLGATFTVNARQVADVPQAVRDGVAPDGTDIAFVAVGHSAVVEQALRTVRPGGRVVLVALFDEPVQISDPFQLVGTEIALIGSQMYVRQDFDVAIDMLASGRLDFRSLVTHRLPIERAEDAFKLAIDRTESPAKIHLTL